VIYPGGTVRFASRQLQRYFAGLKAGGSTRAFMDEMNDFDALNRLIGTPQLLEAGRRYAEDD
jgi:hypothetical protein